MIVELCSALGFLQTCLHTFMNCMYMSTHTHTRVVYDLNMMLIYSNGMSHVTFSPWVNQVGQCEKDMPSNSQNPLNQYINYIREIKGLQLFCSDVCMQSEQTVLSKMSFFPF